MCVSEVFHNAHLNLFSLKTNVDVTATELIKIQFLGYKIFSNVTLNNCKKLKQRKILRILIFISVMVPWWSNSYDTHQDSERPEFYPPLRR